MENIKNELIKNGFLFELIYNEKPIRTAREGAEYFKIDIGQTAATLIIHTDIGFYALVVSGKNGHVDFQLVKNISNCKCVELATKDEVKEVTGFSIGSVPLFGLNLLYIIDEKLLQFSSVYGGSNEKNFTLKVDPKALLKLNKVVGML